MKPTLLVLAAGMGSRYGGLKQIDAIGPEGEAIIEYSIYDAIRAGFGKVVFVIRESIEEPFKEKFKDKFEDQIEVVYAFQEINSPIEGLDEIPAREKPWGTAHAVLVAEHLIQEPFAVVNADDYYGITAFQSLSDFLVNDCTPEHWSMIGYILKNTLSDHGTVNRGVAAMNEHNHLTEIVECKKIENTAEGIFYPAESGERKQLQPDDLVSMNMWGFHPSIFPTLREQFIQFVKDHGAEPKAEFFIPLVVDKEINAGNVKVSVISNGEQWYGVTYQDDKEAVQTAFAKLTEEGHYPAPLWKAAVS